ncbi:MAG: hypothetical protein AAF702_34875 [Chloroflexota bacterium]
MFDSALSDLSATRLGGLGITHTAPVTPSPPTSASTAGTGELVSSLTYSYRFGHIYNIWLRFYESIHLHTLFHRSLANDELAAAAVTYFHNNHKPMQYMEFREDGFPIGSGMVESAAKQFKVRFTGPGMLWSRLGLQRLIPIRTAVLSHSFDYLWDSVFTSPQSEMLPMISVNR